MMTRGTFLSAAGMAFGDHPGAQVAVLFTVLGVIIGTGTVIGVGSIIAGLMAPSRASCGVLGRTRSSC